MSHRVGSGNQMLSRLTRKLVVSPTFPLPDYSYRLEDIPGWKFVSLWFRTRGCSHQLSGGCTFCYYGNGPEVSADELISFVQKGFEVIPRDSKIELLVSPSGSMLDPREIPRKARQGIFSLLSKHPAERITMESRAELVTADALDDVEEFLVEKKPRVEIGLEAQDEFIRRNCVNKNLDIGTFRRAVAKVKERGFRSSANVAIGIPFLSPNESIDEAVATIRIALDCGADECVLFPIHVRMGTLAEWLWKNNLFRPPSIWSYIEVLRRLDSMELACVTLSWYKPYTVHLGHGRFLPKDPTLLEMATTCPHCWDRVRSCLDAFRSSGERGALDATSAIRCSCRDVWGRSLCPAESDLPSRVESAYAFMKLAVGD